MNRHEVQMMMKQQELDMAVHRLRIYKAMIDKFRKQVESLQLPKGHTIEQAFTLMLDALEGVHQGLHDRPFPQDTIKPKKVITQ